MSCRVPAIVIAALALGSTSGAAVGTPPRLPNVLLLTVDSLRADRLGAHGHDAGISQHLDRFALQSRVHENAFATSSWTFPSLISVLTGLYPSTHGYVARGRAVSAQVPTLLELLQQAGYRVPDLTFISSTPGLERLAGDGTWQRGLERERSALAEWLESDAARQVPFFAWYHWRSLHLPYVPSAPVLEGPDRTPGIEQVQQYVVIPASMQGFSPAEEPLVRQLYDGEIRDFDARFGELMALLDARGLADDTIVIVTADHGEELFDHGLLGHASTTLHATLYDEVLRVPLMMRIPGVEPARVSCLASQVDVLPTVLSYLGLPLPARVEGRDLSPDREDACPAGTVVFAETIGGGFQAHGESARTYLWAARSVDHKLIVREFPDGSLQRSLFDLAGDPGETTDAAGRLPEAAVELERRLAERWAGQAGGRAAWRNDIVESPGPRSIATRVANAPTIVAPVDGAVLDFDSSAALVRGEWTGSPAAQYRIEYDVGLGERRTSGGFLVEGTRFQYGPIPLEVWTGLPEFNPWRFRVVPVADPERASAWISIAFR